MMLLFSMSVSADGYITDRDGGIGWTVPSAELFQFHLDRVRELGAVICGRRLYEIMLVWETDPSFADSAAEVEFAEVWAALPKVVFGRPGTAVEGNARLATGSVAEEVERVRTETDRDIEIGGATLAAAAIQLDLVDDFRLFRAPVLLGGGTPYFPPLQQNLELELAETRTFDSNIVYERYLRKRQSAS